MSRYTLKGLLFAVIAVSLLVVLPTLAQQKSEPTTDIPAEIKKLQTQRVQTLEQVLNHRVEQYTQGSGTLDRVFDAQHDLMEAQLEIAETPYRRIELLERHIGIVKSKLKMIEVQVKAGRALQCDALSAKAALLGIEIRILQERAKAMPSPK